MKPFKTTINWLDWFGEPWFGRVYTMPKRYKKDVFEKILKKVDCRFNDIELKISKWENRFPGEVTLNKLREMNGCSMIVPVKYFDGMIPYIEKTDKGDWIDLRAAERVELSAGESYFIPLGVGMILPKGFEAHIKPRSSTFKNWGILKACSGIIDNAYNGNDDQWKFGVYATRDTVIEKYDRICQFRIVENQPKAEFKTVAELNEKSRGGFGSTGVK